MRPFPALERPFGQNKAVILAFLLNNKIFGANRPERGLIKSIPTYRKLPGITAGLILKNLFINRRGTASDSNDHPHKTQNPHLFIHNFTPAHPQLNISWF
jgi:hypothetical protein